MNLNEFAREVHANAVAHGWWETERYPAEIIALIHSEWSEALEEYRAGRPMEYADDFVNCVRITDPDKFTLQLRLRSLLFTELNSDTANSEGIGNQVMTQSLKMASVAIATIPIIIVYPWLQKYFVKGMMLGSVKG